MIKKLISIFSKIYGKSTGGRYVSKFVPVKQVKFSDDELDNLAKYELRDEREKELYEALVSGIENVKKLIPNYPQIKEIKENFIVQVKDINGLYFTVKISDGNASVTPGVEKGFNPSFFFPLYSQNLLNMKTITEDNDVNLEDVYRFIRVLFIPFLRGLYQANYDHLPEDKSYLQLDDFIHVEVKNPTGIEVPGFPGNPKATVVNVDGQWLIFEGWQGEPDIVYSMDVVEAIQFGYIIRVKLIQQQPSLNELQNIVKEYNVLKEKVTVYKREV